MTRLPVLPLSTIKTRSRKNMPATVSLPSRLTLCSVKSTHNPKHKFLFENIFDGIFFGTDLQSVNGTVSAKKGGSLCATRISTPIARWGPRRSCARPLAPCTGRATGRATTPRTQSGALLSARSSASCRPNTATESKPSAGPSKAELCRQPAPSAL